MFNAVVVNVHCADAVAGGIAQEPDMVSHERLLPRWEVDFVGSAACLVSDQDAFLRRGGELIAVLALLPGEVAEDHAPEGS